MPVSHYLDIGIITIKVAGFADNPTMGQIMIVNKLYER